MDISLFGGVRVGDGSIRLNPRDRAVLAVLAMRPGEPIGADRLADALWGDAPPASWVKNLQGCVVRLRKALGSGAIQTSSQGYRLRVAADEIDAQRFERLVTRGRELLGLDQPERSAYLLAEALELWQGRPFLELEDWDPGRIEAGRLDELRLEAEEVQVDATLQAGHHREVLARAQAIADEAPLRERRWELLARAQYQAGRQTDALRTIQRVRRLLVEELGLDPSPSLEALEQAILRQDPTLSVEEPPASADGACPYQGLTPYDVDDAESFFGRDEVVAACLERLRHVGVLAVVGPSGCGKSSLTRAGVAASLQRDKRRVAVITPGAHPTDALTGVPRTRADTVLVVDQLEEVFSLCEDPVERERFLVALVDHARTADLVLSLRADHLGDLAAYPDFAKTIEPGLYLLSAMSEEQLRAAIEGPAHQTGLMVEPGLVDLLIREVKDEPGALPLLSHVLRETWLRREGRSLTVAGYQASGGVRQAVAQSAEAVFQSVGADRQHALRDLLLRLVAPSSSGAPVRTKMPRRLVVADGRQDELIDILVASRLVTSDDEVVEIAHEALARAWPRLRAWLDDDIEGQRTLHHLTESADAWDSLGRPDSELYRGVRLARALAWQDQGHAPMNPVETDFLASSSEAEQVAERSAAEHARRQAVLIRRLRLVLAGAVGLLVLALIAGGFAAVQSDRAARNAAESRQAALSADARRVGARAQLTDDISLSLLLAAAGARLDDSPETRVNLLARVAKQPHLVRSAPPGGGFMEAFSVSRDGRWIASSDDQNRMHLYDAATSRLLRSYDAGWSAGDEPAWIGGAFSPDSSQLAVTLESVESTEPVRLLDPNTMQPTAKLDFPGGQPVVGIDVQFSADGRYLAATVLSASLWESGKEIPGYAVVWDLRSPSTPPMRFPTGPGTLGQGLALSRDGQTLYSSAPLTAYDTATGRRIWRRDGLASYIALDLNSKGTLLALEEYNSGKYALLVDPADGSTVARLRGHRDSVRDIRFSPDGTLVGSVSNDGELIVWDTATGRPLERWDTFDEWGVGFSPDNDLVYGGGGDSMLRTWDLSVQDTYLQQTTQVSDAEVFTHADLSPDGQQVAYRWLDDQDTGWVRFVDTVTGEATPATRLPVSESPWTLGTWHPQGGQYAAYCEACTEKGIVSVLDTATGKLLRKSRDIVDGDGILFSLTYVDAGRDLLVGHPDGTMTIIDAVTLSPRGEPFDVGANCATPIGEGSTAMVCEWSADAASAHWRVLHVGDGEVLSEGDVDVAPYVSVASPDGSTVAVAGDTGQIVTLDVSSGDEQRRSTGLGAAVWWLDYSDDGQRLVSGAADGGVSLWDATTLDLLGTVYPPHDGEAVPAGAQFIGDTHDVAIASYDGSVYRWDTDLERALDVACQMAGRNLTRDEWAEFLPAQPYQEVCPGL